jgi:hypothetical protein
MGVRFTASRQRVESIQQGHCQRIRLATKNLVSPRTDIPLVSWKRSLRVSPFHDLREYPSPIHILHARLLTGRKLPPAFCVDTTKRGGEDGVQWNRILGCEEGHPNA